MFTRLASPEASGSKFHRMHPSVTRISLASPEASGSK